MLVDRFYFIGEYTMYRLAILGLLGLVIITANGNKKMVKKMETNVDTTQVAAKSKLMYFGAEWCGPCRMMKQIFKDKKVENLLDKLDMMVYDVDVNKNLANQYQISTVPTMIFIDKDGIMRRYVGGMSKDSLIKILESYV